MTKITNTTEQQGEAPTKLTEHQTLSALVYPLEVIVSPFKAFKKIAQNPKFLGFLLIVSLSLLATASMEYARASKIFLDADTQTTSLLSSNLFGSYLIYALVRSSSIFILNWLVFAGVLLLIARFFGEKGGPWRPFFIVVGYAFFVLVIYIVINALLISTLPDIHFALSIWSSGAQEDIAKVNSTFNAVWGPTFAAQVQTYLSVAFQSWLVGLSAIALHASREIKWEKAIITSVSAYILSVFLMFFLTIFLA